MCLSSPLAVIGCVLFDAQGDTPDAGCLPFLVLLVVFIAIWIWLERRDEKDIRSLDKAGQITPPGYSKTLALMIASSIGLFALALAWSLIQG